MRERRETDRRVGDPNGEEARRDSAQLASAQGIDRQRLETLLDTLPIAVFISDERGGIVYTNQVVQEIWGDPPAVSSADEYGLYKGWHADTGQRLRAEDWSGARALHGESVLGEIIEIERFDGRRATIMNSSVPIRDAEGRISGQVTVEQDITERASAERELRFQSALLDSVSDSVFVYPADGPDALRLLYVNRANYAQRGFEPAEMLGHNMLDFIHPDWRDRLPGHLEVLAERGEVTFESRHLRKDGTSFPVEVRLGLLEYGDMRVALNLARDITGAKHSEAERERLFRDLDDERRRLRVVLDNMAEGVQLWSPDGTLVETNDAAARIEGYGTKEDVRRRLSEYDEMELSTLDGTRLSPVDGPLGRLLKGESFTDWVLRVHVPWTGARFVGAYSGAVLRDGESRIGLCVLTVHDVSDVFEAQERLQQELDMTALWLRASDALATLELDDVLRVLADAALRGTGASRVLIQLKEGDGVTVAYSRGASAPEVGTFYGPPEISAEYRAALATGSIQVVDLDDEPAPQAVRDFRARHGYLKYVMVPLRAGNETIGAIIIDEPHQRHAFNPATMSFLEGLGPQAAVAIQNARLYRDERERVRLGSALARIDQDIHSSLDVTEVVSTAMELGAHTIGADTAAIDGIEKDMWVVWYDWGFEESIVGHWYTNDQNPHGVIAARSGQTIAIDDAFTDVRVDGPTMRAYGIRSAIVAPLIVRGIPIAALYFNYHQSQHHFTDSEIEFVAKTASSLSLAIENARLYEAERDIADRLQEALLALPDSLGGIDFAHVYHSATESARVGGDFYDVFELGDQLVGVTIGDVAGKGLDAAVLTSLVKNTIRAHATEKGNTPARILEVTNDVVYRATSSESFVTVFFAVIDCRDGCVSYANAGHTATLLVGKAGRVRYLGSTGPILGAFPDASFDEGRVCTDRDEVLFLYTDGLIEARRGGELFGEERLVELLGDVKPDTPVELLDRVVAAVMDFTAGELSDDMALLAVKRQPS